MGSDEDKQKRSGEVEDDVRIDTGVCILYFFSVRHILVGHFEEEKKKKKTRRRSGAMKIRNKAVAKSKRMI